MQILVFTQNNSLIFKGSIEKGIFPEADPEAELYKITDNDIISYAVTNGFTSYEVDKLPDDLDLSRLDKYCYTPEKGFYNNPDYVEPLPLTEDRVSDLEEFTSDLLYQVCLMQLDTSAEDVILESK